MTDTLLKEFKGRIADLTIIPSGGGAFEVTINGTLVHSKKATRQFPAPEAIIEAARAAGVSEP